MPANLKSSLRITSIAAAALNVVLAGPPQLMGSTIYTQTNLVSNSSATAANFTDPNAFMDRPSFDRTHPTPASGAS